MMKLQEAVAGSLFSIVPTTYTTSVEYMARYGPTKDRSGPFLIFGSDAYTPTLTIKMVTNDTLRVRSLTGKDAALVVFKRDMMPLLTPKTFEGNTDIELVLNHEAKLVGAKINNQHILSRAFELVCAQCELPMADHHIPLDWGEFSTIMVKEIITSNAKEEADDRRVAYYSDGRIAAHVNNLTLASVVVCSFPPTSLFALKDCARGDSKEYIEPLLWSHLFDYRPEIGETLYKANAITGDFLGRFLEVVSGC